MNLIKIIQEREDYYKENEILNKKEKNELNNIIDNLNDIKNNSEKEYKDLIYMNQNLHNTLKEVNSEYEKTKNELNNKEKEFKKIGKIIKNVTKENYLIKQSNEELHGMLYGKLDKKN